MEARVEAEAEAMRTSVVVDLSLGEVAHNEVEETTAQHCRLDHM